jgi:hypothetical protein
MGRVAAKLIVDTDQGQDGYISEEEYTSQIHVFQKTLHDEM